MSLALLAAAALAAASSSAEREAFPGVLVPANATDLLGPEASFRIRGWSSFWGGLKILELKADGEQVKAGDVVAKFDFQGRGVLDDIEQRRQKADADAEASRLAGEQRLEGLGISLRRRQLEARLAALDVEKERSVSRKQAAIDKINHRIAEFEADAVSQSLAAAARAVSAEASFQRATVAQPRGDTERYKWYEKRFQLIAPHDGLVRHAFNAGERRKVQKGDQIGSGAKVVSVAKDASLAARFFVPEPHLAQLKKGAEVSITSAAGSTTEYRGVVTSIDYFPQEIGFLMENANLPNGREKAFAVMAELKELPGKLSAGTELRVKVVSP